MTQSEERRTVTNTRIALVEQPDRDTLILRTFWSPLPTWIYGSIGAGLFAGIAALLGLAVGADGNDIEQVVLIAAIVGYFAAAVGWAVLGLVGGDVQRITFDRREDVAHVHQQLFWVWRRNWDFELDEVYRIHVWQKRGRLFFKLSVTEVVEMTFSNDEDSSKLGNLNLGRYPTEIEGLEIGQRVAEFLDAPVSRKEPEDGAAA